MNSAASKRVSGECLLDVYGCSSAVNITSCYSAYNNDLDPADQAERLKRVEITHNDLLSALSTHRSLNIQY